MVSRRRFVTLFAGVLALLTAFAPTTSARPVESKTTTQPTSAESAQTATPAPTTAPADEAQATPAEAETETPANEPAAADAAAARPEPEAAKPEPETAPATQAQAASPEPPLELKPRLELHVPSVQKLMTETERSRIGLFVDYLGTLMRVLSTSSSEGISAAEADAVISVIRSWPDATVHFSAYAPDREGLARWAVQFNWPIEDLRHRLSTLLALDGADELFAGIELVADDDGGAVVRLNDKDLAYLSGTDDGGSVLASHRELPLPQTPFAGTADTEANGPSLLVSRMNLTQTEKDTGSTFLSKFSVVTAVDYGCHVNDAGDWVDSLHVYWPPISGMALKAMFGRVEQTFFVPESAFGAVVFSTMMGPTMLEQMAGFGPQMMMDGSGGIVIVGEAAGGSLSSHIEDTMCLAILPGTGFLPAPDIVVQMRAKNEDAFAKDIRAAIEKINKAYTDREMPAIWHETEVRDRVVFWCDTGARNRGFMMPFVMRPVLFLTNERDAKDKQRDLVVIGWTTTDPQDLVRRWLDLPRPKDRRFLPDERKSNGQLWVHWKSVYDWVQPYINLGLAVASPDALLPTTDEASASLVNGEATARVRYAGLTVAHQGPAPMGIVALPTMVSSSMAVDWSGSSDLARERLACERLKVLYHHSKLFKKDVGRWPAEVRELDGYVDFAGHPYLLHLRLSSRKQWSNWFEDMFGDKKKDEEANAEEEEDTDELYGDIDDSLYVIDWGREHWTLGIAPGTLDHLDKLYIDQDGKIHRVEKKADDQASSQKSADDADKAKI